MKIVMVKKKNYTIIDGLFINIIIKYIIFKINN